MSSFTPRKWFESLSEAEQLKILKDNLSMLRVYRVPTLGGKHRQAQMAHLEQEIARREAALNQVDNP